MGEMPADEFSLGVDESAGGVEGPPVEEGFDPVQALLNTKPDMPIEQVQEQYAEGDRGLAHIIRGLMKVSGADGLPAVVDLVLGLFIKMREAKEANQSGGEPQLA